MDYLACVVQLNAVVPSFSSILLTEQDLGPPGTLVWRNLVEVPEHQRKLRCCVVPLCCSIFCQSKPFR